MDFFKEKFKAENLLEGQIFLIDKPLGWTSFQVVNKIRWHLKNKTGLKKLKVGHAGTLDPLATGLLVICTGKKTKKINDLQLDEKTYIGNLILGSTTPSYDQETKIDATFPTQHITEDLINKAIKSLSGKIKRKGLKINFLIKCSKGTYIRSLAHDFGKKLDSGAHLTSLRRIQSGVQLVENAYTMDSVINENSKKNIRSIKSIL